MVEQMLKISNGSLVSFIVLREDAKKEEGSSTPHNPNPATLLSIQPYKARSSNARKSSFKKLIMTIDAEEKEVPYQLYKDGSDVCIDSGDEDEEESDDVNDDEEFVKNVDMNAEYGGLGNVESQPQQAETAIVGNEVNYSDEGSLMGSDGEATWLKWPKFLQDLEEEPHQVQVTIEPDVITQPEVSDNQWEIPDDILDAQWDQILLHT
nr:uncharacterized protein LOC109185271 [Ipomoea trifida]